jgi:hypothetical protein
MVNFFGGVGLRKTLSVIQFAVSLAAIVILSVFYKQSLFMVTADYGFEKREMLNIPLPQNSYQKLAPAFSAIPGVESVSAASALFGFSGGDTKFIKREKNWRFHCRQLFFSQSVIHHRHQAQINRRRKSSGWFYGQRCAFRFNK